MERTNTSNSINTALRKVESFQYPATHLGHLSQDQETKLQEFKKLAEQKGYFRSESSSHKASHDDETMLRYLRARKFQPQDAFVQFKDTEDWRRDEKIDELYNTIDIDEYEETRRLYPQWTGRRDKRGIPVYTFEVAHLTAKKMSAYEKSAAKSETAGKTSPKLIRLFALYENLLNFAFPLCSGVPDRPYSETPVSQSNNIVDIAGVGLKQFWNLRQHMQDASQLATAHYPETLDRIFVIGAPSFFPTVWSWVKGWFDPITVSKIFILSKQNMKSTLEQYIDSSNIPRKYGGTMDWEWGELPSLEPAIAKAIKWQKPDKNAKGENIFPQGPIRWRTNDAGELEAVAVGSVKGRPREEVVASLPVQEGVRLGAVSSRLDVQQRLFGEPSTTGLHTHPEPEQDYFPTSGVTPPDEHDSASLQQSLASDQNQSGCSAGRDDGLAGAGIAGGAGIAAGGVVYASGHSHPSEQNANIPSDTNIVQGQYQHHSQAAATTDSPTRAGTSTTRYEAQSGTHAENQLAHSTPETIDHGYGDKTATIEPSTVGQAHKKVDVPSLEPAAEEEHQPTYLEQAENAAAGAAATVTGAANTLLAKVGFGGAEENGAATEDSKAEVQTMPVREKQEDSRVDKMQDKDVEDFIRAQYSNHGGGKASKVANGHAS